jgi:hypothetical protein
MFFSPCILPVYSYNPTNNDIVDESDIVKVFLSSLLACFIWSVNLAIFLNPVDIGVCLCCICLLAVAAFYAWAVCYVPQLLGKYSSMISIESIADAAQVAKEMFDDWQNVVDNPDWVTEDKDFALMSAIWFWNKNKLNALADVEDIKLMTKKINGGYIGLEDRIKHYEEAIHLLA